MATRFYTVVGEFSSSRDFEKYQEFPAPEDFENYVYAQLQAHEPLRLTALERQDALARRRGPATPQPFTFRIAELDRFGTFHVSVTDEENHWIQIQTKDGISFAIFD